MREADTPHNPRSYKKREKGFVRPPTSRQIVGLEISRFNENANRCFEIGMNTKADLEERLSTILQKDSSRKKVKALRRLNTQIELDIETWIYSGEHLP